MNNTLIDVVNEYRYLGFDITEHMDYKHSASILNKAASRALGSITAKYISLNGTSYQTFTHVYNTLVAPVMDYACELWVSFKYDGFNTIQHRAMRTYLGVGMCAPLQAIYGDLAGVTPHSRHEVAALRYWFRLTRLPRSRLTRRIFDWDYEFANAGLRSWNLDIKGTLDKCGIGDVFTRVKWGQQSEVNVRHVVTQLNQLDQGQRREGGATMSRLSE